jgi:hypothetical protein
VQTAAAPRYVSTRARSGGLRKSPACRDALEWFRNELRARFYIDPTTESPHIYNHQVNEDEVVDVLDKPGEDRAGREGSRVAFGQTASGRFLRVVYVPDPEPDSVFVITAWELTGKPLAAYRKRRKKKHQ